MFDTASLRTPTHPGAPRRTEDELDPARQVDIAHGTRDRYLTREHDAKVVEVTDTRHETAGAER